MIKTLEQLIDYCKEEHRICPIPIQWNNLYNLLKDKRRNGNSWEPPLPLILAAWWDTPAMLKQLRLIEHLKWAEGKGQLKEIIDFLSNLSEDQWFHIND